MTPKTPNSTRRRIREKAPNRRSVSLTDEDIKRLSYLEETFTRNCPDETPFTFSKTISIAVELAYILVLDPRLDITQDQSGECQVSFYYLDPESVKKYLNLIGRI